MEHMIVYQKAKIHLPINYQMHWLPNCLVMNIEFQLVLENIWELLLQDMHINI